MRYFVFKQIRCDELLDEDDEPAIRAAATACLGGKNPPTVAETLRALGLRISGLFGFFGGSLLLTFDLNKRSMDRLRASKKTSMLLMALLMRSM